MLLCKPFVLERIGKNPRVDYPSTVLHLIWNIYTIHYGSLQFTMVVLKFFNI